MQLSGSHATKSLQVHEYTGSETDRRINSGKTNYYLSVPSSGQAEAIDLKPGRELLDRFAIRLFLGRGSFGTVYLAFDALKAMDVALKVVLVDSEAAAKRVAQEIKLSYLVNDYRHVIRLYDIHSLLLDEAMALLIAMEYGEGGSLRQRLEENTDIDRRRAEGLAFFRQACLAVESLHSVGLVHQDLKPENFVIVNSVLKVTDLGQAKSIWKLQADDEGQLLTDLAGQRPCTPAYVAPEQLWAAHQDDIGPEADVHALGAILFEIYHPQCRPPFGGSYQQILQHHLCNVPVPTLEGTDPHIARIVAKCLEKDPTLRYSSVSELLGDLEGGSSSLQTAPPALELQEMQQLWQQACQRVEAGDLIVADRLCSQILSVCPDDVDARTMLADIENRDKKAREFYAAIQSGIGNQPLDQLAILVAEAVAIYPGHPGGYLVQVRLLATATEYLDVMQEGAKALRRGQWQAALTCFRRALQLNPGVPAVQQLVDRVSLIPRQIGTARSHIDAALAQYRGEEAMSLARDIDQYVQNIKNIV